MIKHAILLAGGEGTRLRPFSYYTSKHLLPIHDKPMIFYPLKNLIFLGVENICLVINKNHMDQWKELFDNLNLKVNITLVCQDNAEGIPHALKLCERFINNKDHYLALGDNILIGSNMMKNFRSICLDQRKGAVIIGYPVKNISEFGIAEFNYNNDLFRVIEKPEQSDSNLAVVGLYKFDSEVFEIFDNLLKSKRGEYEVADLINFYIEQNCCSILKVDSPANYWLDTGTVERINSASLFIRELSKAGNVNFGDLEE